MHTSPALVSLAARIVATALLAGAYGGAVADGLEKAHERGKLVAGIDYPLPEFRGGMKFRTPEAIDTALLDDVAKRLRVPLATMRTGADRSAELLANGAADLALVSLDDKGLLARELQQRAILIPTAYVAGPMAIMRTDTDIKRWEQLKGRKVCVAEGGRHVGRLSAMYGAVEQVHRAPADSLLALRIGTCDAAVHDSAMLEELIKLPEWKKFSARLPTGPRATLAFVVPANDKQSAAFLKQVTQDWAARSHLTETMKKAVRHIAFEVYLDQDVPDCH